MTEQQQQQACNRPDSQRPDVGRGPVRPGGEDLRRRPQRPSCPVAGASVGCPPGGAEIAQLDATGACDKNVAGLHIAVDEPFGVETGQGLQRLPAHVGDLLLTQPAGRQVQQVLHSA